MALIIGTNMASLNAQRHLSTAQNKSATAMERLSTGLRINSGKDDAAGLAIGSRIGSVIRGLNQAVKNANDGISLAKSGDGALAELGSMLDRMRELATESGNGVLSTSDLANIDTEMDAIGTEIDNIIATASFNGNVLLGGLANVFQVGETVADIYTFATTAVTGGLSSISSIANIETAIDEVSAARGEFGIAMSALESRSNNASTLSENLSAARSRIMDADIAQETANMTQANVMQQAGIAVLAQANQAPNMVLALLR